LKLLNDFGIAINNGKDQLNEAVLNECIAEVSRQVDLLLRKALAIKALENSKTMLLNNLAQCFAFSNLYAPKRLIIASEKATSFCTLSCVYCQVPTL